VTTRMMPTTHCASVPRCKKCAIAKTSSFDLILSAVE
jgi:hypothetical protein